MLTPKFPLPLITARLTVQCTVRFTVPYKYDCTIQFTVKFSAGKKVFFAD